MQRRTLDADPGAHDLERLRQLLCWREPDRLFTVVGLERVHSISLLEPRGPVIHRDLGRPSALRWLDHSSGSLAGRRATGAATY